MPIRTAVLGWREKVERRQSRAGSRQTRRGCWSYPRSSDVHLSTNHSVKELAFIAALTDPADLKAVKCFRNMIKGKSTFFLCSLHYGPLLSSFLSSLPSWTRSLQHGRAAPFKVEASPDKDNSFTPPLHNKTQIQHRFPLQGLFNPLSRPMLN